MAGLDDAMVDGLHRVLEERLSGAGSVEKAASLFVACLFEQLPAVALVRVYATLSMRSLGPEERAFAEDAARKAAVTLQKRSPVLVLLASRGTRPAWNDRTQSKGHRAIPLAPKLVEGAPMLARLIDDLGLGIGAITDAGVETTRTGAGGLNRLFYVDDARTSVDARMRKIIPAQDFVDAEGIRTVFGFGGWIVGGMGIATIVFSRETIDRASATHVASLGATFKLALLEHFHQGEIWIPK